MRLLTMKQVCEKVGYSRTQVRRFFEEEKYFHLGFPRPIKHFKLLWSEDEVDGWIRHQLETRWLL